MIFVWRRFGWLAPLVLIASIILGIELDLPMWSSMLVAAIFNGAIAWAINYRFRDAQIQPKSSLYWIPLEFWSGIFLLASFFLLYLELKD